MTIEIRIPSPMPTKPMPNLRVAFDVTGDFLTEAQDVLFSLPGRLSRMGHYIELLRDLALDPKVDRDDPRLIAAFEMAEERARSLATVEGGTLATLFDLIDDEKNISKAA
jgi:hypothetical protein